MTTTETWVEHLEPELAPGDPGPIEMTQVTFDWLWRRHESPSLVREDSWRHGKPAPRWWRRVR